MIYAPCNARCCSGLKSEPELEPCTTKVTQPNAPGNKREAGREEDRAKPFLRGKSRRERGGG